MFHDRRGVVKIVPVRVPDLEHSLRDVAKDLLCRVTAVWIQGPVHQRWKEDHCSASMGLNPEPVGTNFGEVSCSTVTFAKVCEYRHKRPKDLMFRREGRWQFACRMQQSDVKRATQSGSYRLPWIQLGKTVTKRH